MTTRLRRRGGGGGGVQADHRAQPLKAVAPAGGWGGGAGVG